MKKAIFGGTFDPIHIGHIHIAYEALYKLNLEEVLFMPNGMPPHKTNKIVSPANVRYEMVEKAIEGEKKFNISSYEIDRGGMSYTYETLIHFNECEPNTEWFFLTGVDSLMYVEKWKNTQTILDNCNFVVFSRPGFSEKEIIEKKNQVEKMYNRKIIYLDIPILDVSSTFIKQRIKENKVIAYLLPKGVDEIISDKGLYR